MLFYRCDPSFKYIRPITAAAGTFGTPTEMRKLRIFRSMDAARSAQRVYQRTMAATKAKRLAKRAKK